MSDHRRMGGGLSIFATCELVLYILMTACAVLYLTKLWEPAGDFLSPLILIRLLLVWPESARKAERWERIQEGTLEPEKLDEPAPLVLKIVTIVCGLLILLAFIYNWFFL